MIIPMASTQSKLILEHYLDYQRQQERQITLKEYAEHLQIHETTLNLLINDKRSISNNMAAHLAKKTGDNRFYDLKGLPHPDPIFTYVVNKWQELKPEFQRMIKDQVAKYLSENDDDDSAPKS